MDEKTLRSMYEGKGLFTNGASPIDLGRLSRWWDKLRGKEPAKPEAKPDYKPTHELVKDVGSIGINVVRHETGGNQGGERKLPGELVDFYMTQLDKMVVGMREMILKGYNQAGLFPNSADRWRAAGMADAAGVVDPNFLVETNLFDLVTDNEGNMDKDKVKKILTSGTGNRDHFIKLIQTHIDQDTSRLFSRIGIRQSLDPARQRNYIDHSRLFLNLDRGTANQILVDALKSALERFTTNGGRKHRSDIGGYTMMVAALLMTPLAGFVGASAAAGLAASLGVATSVSLGAALGVSAASVLNTVGVTSLTAGGAALGAGIIPLLFNVNKQGVRINNTNNGIGSGLQGQMTNDIFADPARRDREEKYLQDMHGVDLSSASPGNMTPQRTILERGMVSVIARLMYRQTVLGEKQGAADAMLDDAIILARPGDPVSFEKADLTMNDDIIQLFRAEYATIAAARGLDANAIREFPNVNEDQHRAAMLEALRIARGRYAVREAQELHLEVIKIESTAETNMKSSLEKKLEGAARPDEYPDGSINVDDLVDPLGNLRTSASIDSEVDEVKKKKLKNLGLFRDRAAALAAGGPNPIEAYQRYRKQREHVFTKGEKKVIDDLRVLERSTVSVNLQELHDQLFPAGATGFDSERVVYFVNAILNKNFAVGGLPNLNYTGGVLNNINIRGLLINGSISELFAAEETRINNRLTDLNAPAGADSILELEQTIDPAQPAQRTVNGFNEFKAGIQQKQKDLAQIVTSANGALSSLPLGAPGIAIANAQIFQANEQLAQLGEVLIRISSPNILPANRTVTHGTLPPIVIPYDKHEHDVAETYVNNVKRTITRLKSEKARLEEELVDVTSRKEVGPFKSPFVERLSTTKKFLADWLVEYQKKITESNTGANKEIIDRVTQFTSECRAAFSEFTIGPVPQLTSAQLGANNVDVLTGLATAAGFWTDAEENRPENRAKLQRARVWALARAGVAAGVEPSNTDIRMAVERESVSLEALISTQHTRLMDARRGVEANSSVIRSAQEVNERRKVVGDSQEHIGKLVHDFTEARQTNPATRYDVVYDPAVTAAETNYQTLHALPPIYFTLLNYLVGYTGDAAKRSRSFTTASTIYTPVEMRDLLCRLPLLAPMAAQPFNAVAVQLGTYLGNGQIVATELRRELRNRANQHVNAAISI